MTASKKILVLIGVTAADNFQKVITPSKLESGVTPGKFPLRDGPLGDRETRPGVSGKWVEPASALVRQFSRKKKEKKHFLKKKKEFLKKKKHFLWAFYYIYSGLESSLISTRYVQEFLVFIHEEHDNGCA